MSQSRLFKPLKVGNVTLNNRIAMAPLTRFRASDEHIPLPMVAEYYAQRASVAGTLLVTEATFITKENGGYPNVPGIYNDDQIKAWRTVTDAVHKKGSYIYLQLWALGRVANPKVAEQEGFTVKSSSAVALSADLATPVPLTIPEIEETTKSYAQAAKNAIAAGFDGVEIHGANGYLVDQFLQDKVNQRTDAYGGSIENRSRFALEVVEAVVEAVGAERTGIRFSPFSTFQGMRMDDPIPQFSDIISKINKFGLAYLHVVESRISGNADVVASDKLDFAVNLFDGPLLIAGGFRPDSAKKLVDEEYPNRDVLVVFGRYFISTPDLVFRIQEGIALNEYDRQQFYNPKSADGYTDYPFSQEFLASTGAKAKA
ncbi:FMN-linked oxidoreductase [Lindgomyces ingoldianus]|uniref:FMN-linked oxidoreductase n=1 Tax=Lindgomyces ingoldianus TaxID=673940 RepID=A0ACB6Q9P6_9PLEO|nr:FMN-linked oxidoreductase [Lindgomyces ingoldianus]KAF2462860.1 FMN-linked oxidoreductase [Lindgomyces ingoldianus]